MRIIDLLQNVDYKEKFVLKKLIVHHTGIDKNDLWVRADEVLDDGLVVVILSDYHKYADEKMPLEYVIGEVIFFGHNFLVNQAVLIPRPETEYMIEAVVNPPFPPLSRGVSLLAGSGQNVLIDVGTGSGVLWTSVVLQKPDLFEKVILTDVEANALEVAKKNFYRHISKPSFEVEFVCASLLDFLAGEKEPFADADNIVLVSNAPYIPDETLYTEVEENVSKWEPHVALLGGPDGLDLYRQLLKQIMEYLSDFRGRLVCFFEMMTWQCDILRQEFAEDFVFDEVKTFHANIRIIECRFVIKE